MSYRFDSTHVEPACHTPFPSKLVALYDSIGSFIKRVADSARVNRVCVGLSVQGRRQVFRFQRDCTQDSGSADRFHASCMIKPMISSLVLDIADRGFLDIDSPIGEYIPELRNTTKGNDIRLSHLLSHTGGYAGITSGVQIRDESERVALFNTVARARQLFFPGTVFSYELSSTLLVQEILANVTKESVSELLYDTVLAPLHLDATDSIREEADGANRVEKNLWLPYRLRFSVEDLLTLGEAYLGSLPNSGTPQPKCLRTLDSLSRQAITIPRVVGGRAWAVLPTFHGMGFAGFRRGLVGQDGTSKNDVVGLRLHPSRKVVIAIGLDSHIPIIRREILDGIIDRLGLPEDSATRVSSEQFHLDDIVGTYVGNDGWHVEVQPSPNGIQLAIYVANRELIRLTGKIKGHNHIAFNHPDASLEPAFFRNPSQDAETCIMMGICALKRVAGGI